MSKLILENRTDLPLSIFLDRVKEITDLGRISNDGKQYCYLVAFAYKDEEYHVVSDLNKNSDKFTMYKVPTHSVTIKHEQ